ncbi:unnamed protein product [Aphanomyces euteiches]
MQQRPLKSYTAGILLYETSPTAQPRQQGGSMRRQSVRSDTPTIRTDFMDLTASGTFPLHEMSDRDYPLLDEGSTHPPKGTTRKPNHLSCPLASLPIVNPYAVLVGALVGLGVGIGLYFLKIGPGWFLLIALPGTLFLQALQCISIPLVFCVMVVVVAQMATIGRTSILRWQTGVTYAVTALLAALQGFALALLFKSWLQAGNPAVQTTCTESTYNLTMRCSNGRLVAPTGGPNSSYACVASSNTSLALFLAKNETSIVSNRPDTVSFMDVVTAVSQLFVPINIFGCFKDGLLLSIVIFAIPFGITAASITPHGDESNYVLALVRQLRDLFLRMLHVLLLLTPFAIAFLVASAVGQLQLYYTDDMAAQIGFLFVAFLLGVAVHSLIVLPLYMAVLTRTNPYPYIRELAPAYLFAFASASSLASLPVAIDCIERAKVSRAFAQVAMPFGTPMNLNGTGLYYPLTIMFMANVSGACNNMTALRYLVLFSVSLFGCIGTAPVPNGALIYLTFMWSACFPSTPLPQAFAFIVAADFILDRFCTMVNLHANAVVTRILSDHIDEAFEAQSALYL